MTTTRKHDTQIAQTVINRNAAEVDVLLGNEIDGGVPNSNSILPWSVNSIKTGRVAYHQGTLCGDIVNQVVVKLREYIK